eukprot:scaffold12586_cov132-Isochrysis_galbana.AAC.3
MNRVRGDYSYSTHFIVGADCRVLGPALGSVATHRARLRAQCQAPNMRVAIVAKVWHPDPCTCTDRRYALLAEDARA